MTDDIHALSGAYAVDALDDPERDGFENHLAGCAICRDEVQSLLVTAIELSVITETAPPASLRDGVLSGIRHVRPLPPLRRADAPAPTGFTSRASEVGAENIAGIDDPDSNPLADAADAPVVPHGPVSGTPSEQHDSRGAAVTSITAGRRRSGQPGPSRTLWRGLVAAAAAAVLVLGGFTIWRSLETHNPPTVAQQVLDAPDAQKAEHTFANGGTATIVRSVSLGKAVLVGSNLPSPGTAKTYQLWLQSKDSSYTSAGLVPGAGDQVVVLDGSAADAAGAGITIEPAGGSKQPTTEPLALFPFSA